MRWTMAITIALLVAWPAWAAEERAYEPDDATVLLLHFDGAGEDVALDASASGLNAKMLPPPRRPAWEDEGLFGRCLRFDGVNADEDGDGRGDADGLLFTDPGLLGPGEAFTLEAWINPDRVEGSQGLISRSGGARYCLFRQGRALYFSMLLSGGEQPQWARITSPEVIETDRWQHIAITWDGEVLRAWVDGLQVAEQPVEGTPATGESITMIGCDTDSRPIDGAIRGYKGLIDEVRISNIVRDDFNVSEERTAARAEKPATSDLPQRSGQPDPPPPPVIERHVTVTGRALQANGAPLPGVLVTDGEHVVRTDAQGAYELQFDLDDLRMVSVSCPRGFRAEGDWFVRIPRDEEATSYRHDFTLAPDPMTDREQFTFLASGDTQFNDVGTCRELQAEFDHFTRMSGDPAFVTLAGDLTMSGTQWEMDLYATVIANSHIPVRNCFGGHDGNYARENLGQAHGSVYHYEMNLAPAWYSWDCGPVHFATYVSETSFLTERQLALQTTWLEADLAAQPSDTPIVLVTHQAPSEEQMRTWLERYRIIGVLIGHWHRVQSFEVAGVPVLETGPMRGRDWGAFTRQFRVLSYADGALTSETRVCGQVERLEIVAPQGAVARGNVPVEVKAYDTTRRVSDVSCEIEVGGRSVPVELGRVGAWTWRGTWDTADAPVGAITVRATARDEAGAEWSASAEAELTGEAAVAARPAEDWPGFFRAAHSRVREQPLAPPLGLVWSVNTGGRNMKAVSPIVIDGRLYVGVENKEIGHPGAGVNCYDAANGALLWHAPTGASVPGALASGGGLVYALDSAGVCHALDVDSGDERWRSEPLSSASAGRDVLTSPVLHGGELYLLDDAGACAVLDAASGEVLRTLQPARSLMYSAFPSVADGRLFVGYRKTAAAVDAMTGEDAWRVPIGTGKAASCPVPNGEVVYVNAATLTCLGLETGEERWKQAVPTSGNGVSVAVPAGNVVLANGAWLKAFDTQSGEQRWQHDWAADVLPEAAEHNLRQSRAGQSTPLVAGGVVYAASDDGDLCALSLESGEVLWRYRLGVPVKGSPVVSGNALYVCDWDGNLYCFAGR